MIKHEIQVRAHIIHIFIPRFISREYARAKKKKNANTHCPYGMDPTKMWDDAL